MDINPVCFCEEPDGDEIYKLCSPFSRKQIYFLKMFNITGLRRILIKAVIPEDCSLVCSSVTHNKHVLKTEDGCMELSDLKNASKTPTPLILHLLF